MNEMYRQVTPDKIATLVKTLHKLVERNHPYALKMAEAGVRPEHIRTAEDLRSLPFCTKQDLQEQYPLGWLACDRKDLLRYHATSGTTGNPTVVAYTRNDRDAWADCVAWCLKLAGLSDVDTIQVSYGYGLFTGGLGLHDGAEKLGLSVVPASGGFSTRQVALMRDLHVTALACTPSYALRIVEIVKKNPIETNGHHLKVGIFGAEAWSEGVRKHIETSLGIKALDIYGLSEAMGPGVAQECLEQNGLHIPGDAFIAEVVNPETLEPVAPGEIGELVLTSLRKEAFPIVRYRTRDLTRYLADPCPCGTGGPRIDRLRGRSDDMIIIRGVNVFPTQVEAALMKVKGLTPNYQIEVWSENRMHQMTVGCERDPETHPGSAMELQIRGQKMLKEILGVYVPFNVLEPDTLEKSGGKTKHLVWVEKNGNGNGNGKK